MFQLLLNLTDDRTDDLPVRREGGREGGRKGRRELDADILVYIIFIYMYLPNQKVLC